MVLPGLYMLPAFKMPLFKNVVEDADKNLYYVKSELISHIVVTHQARHQQLDGLIMLYSK